MDFTKMNGPQLVAAWNEMVLTATDLGLSVKPVKKFADPTTGRKRCEKLDAQIKQSWEKPVQAAVEDDGSIPEFLKRDRVVIPSNPTLASVTRPVLSTEKARDFRIPKGMSDEEGKAMLARRAEEKRIKAGQRIAALLEKNKQKAAEKLASVNAKRAEKGLAPLATLEAETKPSKSKEEATVRTKTKTKTKKTKANGAKGKWMPNDATITLLAKENPKRKGTMAFKLWEKYKNGMTVGAYKEVAKQHAMPYLRWDIAHGLVKVSQ